VPRPAIANSSTAVITYLYFRGYFCSVSHVS